jgi:hypothetical protein
LVGFLNITDERAGAGSESVRGPDSYKNMTDPHQNVTESQHWKLDTIKVQNSRAFLSYTEFPERLFRHTEEAGLLQGAPAGAEEGAGQSAGHWGRSVPGHFCLLPAGQPVLGHQVRAQYQDIAAYYQLASQYLDIRSGLTTHHATIFTNKYGSKKIYKNPPLPKKNIKKVMVVNFNPFSFSSNCLAS